MEEKTSEWNRGWRKRKRKSGGKETAAEVAREEEQMMKVEEDRTKTKEEMVAAHGASDDEDGAEEVELFKTCIFEKKFLKYEGSILGFTRGYQKLVVLLMSEGQ